MTTFDPTKPYRFRDPSEGTPEIFKVIEDRILGCYTNKNGGVYVTSWHLDGEYNAVQKHPFDLVNIIEPPAPLREDAYNVPMPIAEINRGEVFIYRATFKGEYLEQAK